MRAAAVHFFLSLALRLSRHADVRACLTMTLADVEDWHNGAVPPTADTPWYGTHCPSPVPCCNPRDLDLRAVCPGCADTVPYSDVAQGAVFCERCALVSLVP